MKNYLLFTFITLTLLVSCKKDNNDTPEPSQLYRIIKMEYIFPADSLTSEYLYTYEDEKLIHIRSESSRVYFVSYLNYVTNDQIDVLDSIMENSEPVVYEGSYFLQNGLITQITFTYIHPSNTTYTYSDGQLIECVTYNASQEADSKKVYTYQNEKLATYEEYDYSDDKGAWELWLRNEYTWYGDELKQILNYLAMFEPSDFKLRTKWEFVSQGNVPVKATSYSLDNSDEWQKYSEFFFSYNPEGYLEEVREEVTVNGSSVVYFILSLQYEKGESNMNMFNKTTPEKGVFGDYLPPQFMISYF